MNRPFQIRLRTLFQLMIAVAVLLGVIGMLELAKVMAAVAYVDTQLKALAGVMLAAFFSIPFAFWLATRTR